MSMKFVARAALTACSVFAVSTAALADDEKLLSVEHYLQVKSIAPAIAGQDALLYVREVVAPASIMRGAQNKVVVFVHGNGTPSSAAFDVKYKDYSWLTYLAKAGFDVFLLDLTGYGYSTRPLVMNNPCNLAKAAQAQFVPSRIPAVCEPSFSGAVTNSTSDWNDLGVVVDKLRALRHVDKVSLVGWSQGASRTVGYTLRNPQKVDKLVILGPLYMRSGPTDEPKVPVPPDRGSFTTQTRDEFMSGWNRQQTCANQTDPGIAEPFWQGMLSSDPVGATWGPGVRRSPQSPFWGFNQTTVAKLETPIVVISGATDSVTPPARVKEFYEDVGSKQKILVDIACSSHNAMLENNHLLLFKASLDFLTTGKVSDQADGIVKLGY